MMEAALLKKAKPSVSIAWWLLNRGLPLNEGLSVLSSLKGCLKFTNINRN